MRYLTEPRDIRERLWIFPKNIGKSLSNKYGQKHLDSAKISTANAMKTASKGAI